MNSGGLVQIPVGSDPIHRFEGRRRRRGSDEACLGARKIICNGLGACMRADRARSRVACRAPYLIHPYSNRTCQTARHCRVAGKGPGWQAVAPSSRVCSGITQMARAAASTGSCPFLQFGSGGRVWCRCSCSCRRGCRCRCWAGLGCSGGHARGRIRTAHSVARSLTCSSSFPPAPSGRCGNQREGPAPRSLGLCRRPPGCPGGCSNTANSVRALAILFAPRGTRLSILNCSGPDRHPVPCGFPVTRCTHKITQQEMREGLLGGAKPGSPDPSKSEAALYCRYCIRPSHPPKTRHTTASP